MNSNTNRKHSKGITLIELLIVIAIIAILGGIGYPAYVEQVDKARRGEAQGALIALGNAMEQYKAMNQNTGYAGATLGDGVNDIFPARAPLDGGEEYYDLTIIPEVDGAGFGTGYELQAAPFGPMAGDDCGTFSLFSTGERTVSVDPLPAGTVCWR